MKKKWIQAMKESNPGLNNDLGITITSSENFPKKKREERENLVDNIPPLSTRGCTLIENMKGFQIYRWYSDYGIEVKMNSIFQKYGIKTETCHGVYINGVCVRHLIDYSEDTIQKLFILSKEMSPMKMFKRYE